MLRVDSFRPFRSKNQEHFTLRLGLLRLFKPQPGGCRGKQEGFEIAKSFLPGNLSTSNQTSSKIQETDESIHKPEWELDGDCGLGPLRGAGGNISSTSNPICKVKLRQAPELEHPRVVLRSLRARQAFLLPAWPVW